MLENVRRGEGVGWWPKGIEVGAPMAISRDDWTPRDFSCIALDLSDSSLARDKSRGKMLFAAFWMTGTV
jgi:hypothetical protein